MANFEVSATYDDEIKKLEPTTPGHADYFNEIFQKLINNDTFIKKVAEQQLAIMQSHLNNENEPHQEVFNTYYQQLVAYTDKAIADLINGAPETADTLRELADLIDENKDVATALDEAIGKKANQTELDHALSSIDSLNTNLTNIKKGYYSSINPVTDLNSFYSGIGLFSSSTLNLPESDWFLVVSGGSGGTTCQRAVKLWNGGEYHRYCAAGTWSQWMDGTISWGNVIDKPGTFPPSSHNHDSSYIARDKSVSKIFLTDCITNWAMLTATIDGKNYSIPFSGDTGTGYIEHVAMVWRNNKRQLRICWRQDGAEYINYLNVDE